MGQVDLVYIGQVQTQPTLIGYIEGAPPVPSENLSRPYYLNQASSLYTTYNDATTATLTQQGSERIAYSSNTTSTTDVDFKSAFGVFGVNSYTEWQIMLVNTSAYDLKAVAQVAASAKATFGDKQDTELSGEWTTSQRDTIGLGGDWEPYQADASQYLNPQVGRQFVPENLGYALVESLTADFYAMVYHATGAAIGTIIVPNLAIPPDRNLLMFPIDEAYTKNGTLDGKVGLVNDPSWPSADASRGSYIRPAEAYALAASIEAQNQSRQAYAAQFDWKGRGQDGTADVSDVKPNLPVRWDGGPGEEPQAVPATGIVNRYVWSADIGLHVEQQGYASVSSRSFTGWRDIGGGGGVSSSGEFFFYLGFALFAGPHDDPHGGRACRAPGGRPAERGARRDAGRGGMPVGLGSGREGGLLRRRRGVPAGPLSWEGTPVPVHELPAASGPEVRAGLHRDRRPGLAGDVE
ncbi:hypothetical protein [Nonomuraea basaltis]|uniref:hypothetical protein n=1 Tax=Nonomuraea basaltis TaxID=2495887 RepID=UPI00110C44E3|nr:hypothetical protein [Nonomuraea basaltis]TMR90051.1 hypothetical protein EJK15_57310 [Nonomuraea basaltis]